MNMVLTLGFLCAAGVSAQRCDYEGCPPEDASVAGGAAGASSTSIGGSATGGALLTGGTSAIGSTETGGAEATGGYSSTGGDTSAMTCMPKDMACDISSPLLCCSGVCAGGLCQ